MYLQNEVAKHDLIHHLNCAVDLDFNPTSIHSLLNYCNLWCTYKESKRVFDYMCEFLELRFMYAQKDTDKGCKQIYLNVLHSIKLNDTVNHNLVNILIKE